MVGSWNFVNVINMWSSSLPGNLPSIWVKLLPLLWLEVGKNQFYAHNSLNIGLNKKYRRTKRKFIKFPTKTVSYILSLSPIQTLQNGVKICPLQRTIILFYFTSHILAHHGLEAWRIVRILWRSWMAWRKEKVLLSCEGSFARAWTGLLGTWWDLRVVAR